MSRLQGFVGSRDPAVVEKQQRLNAKIEEMGFAEALQDTSLQADVGFNQPSLGASWRRIVGDQQRVLIPRTQLSRITSGSLDTNTSSSNSLSEGPVTKRYETLRLKQELPPGPDDRNDPFDTDIEHFEDTTTLSNDAQLGASGDRFRNHDRDQRSLDPHHEVENVHHESEKFLFREGRQEIDREYVQQRQKSYSALEDQGNEDNEDVGDGSSDDGLLDEEDQTVEEYMLAKAMSPSVSRKLSKAEFTQHRQGWSREPREERSRSPWASPMSRRTLALRTGTDQPSNPANAASLPKVKSNTAQIESLTNFNQAQRQVPDNNAETLRQISSNDLHKTTIEKKSWMVLPGMPNLKPDEGEHLFYQETFAAQISEKTPILEHGKSPDRHVETMRDQILVPAQHELSGPGKLDREFDPCGLEQDGFGVPISQEISNGRFTKGGDNPTEEAPISGLKRPLKLDYSPVQLSAMTYDQLRSEPFDHNPHAASSVPQNGFTCGTINEKLTYIYDLQGLQKSEEERRALFTALTIDQYEVCGDLMLGTFSELLKKYKEIRQEKRNVGRQFEMEVARREELIAARRVAVEQGLGRLKRAGEDVVRGKSV
ncbi:hypothetical protein MMC12_004092 [Toensbergia leucococca]|nr:hypothetical protein [Toensbergia leucococca]